MSGRLFGYLKDAVHRELCSMLCGSLDGKGVWERMDICMCMAESLSGCPPEHITTLLTGYVLSHFSCVQLFATLYIVACQAPLCMAFSGQESWSGLPCLPLLTHVKRIEQMNMIFILFCSTASVCCLSQYVHVELSKIRVVFVSFHY